MEVAGLDRQSQIFHMQIYLKKKEKEKEKERERERDGDFSHSTVNPAINLIFKQNVHFFIVVYFLFLLKLF